MKVLYDLDGFKGDVGGVARCTTELIAHLPQNIEPEIAIKVCDNVHFLHSNIKEGVTPCQVNCANFMFGMKFPGKQRLFNWLESNISIFPTYTNINKPYSIEALKRQDFDIFHCPSTTADLYFLDYLKGKPLVLTVHDMISELFRSRNNLQTIIKSKLVPLASHIITVSNKTKEDLMNIMEVPEEKISVIYHGAPSMQSSIPSRLFSEPYFLFVGRRNGYKNFEQTLIDFLTFHHDYPDPLLVTTGSPFDKKERTLIKELGLKGSVVNIFATEEELASLYRYAIAFIFPSLYEGFGLPILESFVYECPALLNDTSCFPEIAQDAAIFFHSRPEDGISNLSEKMRMIYTMTKNERNEIVGKGKKRCAEFSWEKSARELAVVYERVYSKSLG